MSSHGYLLGLCMKAHPNVKNVRKTIHRWTSQKAHTMHTPPQKKPLSTRRTVLVREWIHGVDVCSHHKGGFCRPQQHGLDGGVRLHQLQDLRQTTTGRRAQAAISHIHPSLHTTTFQKIGESISPYRAYDATIPPSNPHHHTTVIDKHSSSNFTIHGYHDATIPPSTSSSSHHSH